MKENGDHGAVCFDVPHASQQGARQYYHKSPHFLELQRCTHFKFENSAVAQSRGEVPGYGLSYICFLYTINNATNALFSPFSTDFDCEVTAAAIIKYFVCVYFCYRHTTQRF